MTPFMHHRVDMTPFGEGVCNCGEVTQWIDEHVAVWASRDEELTRRVTIAADELEPGDVIHRVQFMGDEVYAADPPTDVLAVREENALTHVTVEAGTFQCRRNSRVTIDTTRPIKKEQEYATEH